MRTAVIAALWALPGCGGGTPGAVVLSRGDTVPRALAGRSRETLATYFTREASFADTGASITITATLLDRAYVIAAQRARARAVRWPAGHARRELARALGYYTGARLAFEVRVSGSFEEPILDARFLDVAGWQWTLTSGAGEPTVASDAVTTGKRSWTEQSGGGYFQGRTYVPEPVYLIRRYETRGVVRFGPPSPPLGRALVLRGYPPGVPAVLVLRWRIVGQ